jgi:hypothetical protein
MPTSNTPTTPNSPPLTKELKASSDNIADDLNFAERASHIRENHELSVKAGKAVESVKRNDPEEYRELQALKKANRPDLVP